VSLTTPPLTGGKVMPWEMFEWTDLKALLKARLVEAHP